MRIFIVIFMLFAVVKSFASMDTRCSNASQSTKYVEVENHNSTYREVIFRGVVVDYKNIVFDTSEMKGVSEIWAHDNAALRRVFTAKILLTGHKLSEQIICEQFWKDDNADH